MNDPESVIASKDQPTFHVLMHDDDTLTLKIGENNANGEGRGRRISYSFIEATELATNLEEVIQNIPANK